MGFQFRITVEQEIYFQDDWNQEYKKQSPSNGRLLEEISPNISFHWKITEVQTGWESINILVF